MEVNGHLDILSLLQAIENSRQFLLLRTDIRTENSRWVPLILICLNADCFSPLVSLDLL